MDAGGNQRKKTFELFLDKVNAGSDVEHKFVARFPGKAVVIKGCTLNLNEIIEKILHHEGITYLLDTPFGVRMVFITADGISLTTPVGEYRKECGWHIIKTPSYEMIVEETENTERAFCAELSWRISHQEGKRMQAVY